MSHINKNEYIDLILDDKKAYIKSLLELKDFTLMGKIVRHSGKKFAFIQELYSISPFKKLDSKYKIFKNEQDIFIKAYLANSTEFDDGDWVTFQLEFNDSNHWEIEKNNLFTAENVISINKNEIEFSDDFFDELSENLFLFINKKMGPPEIRGSIKTILKDRYRNKKKELSENLNLELEELNRTIDNLKEVEKDQRLRLADIDEQLKTMKEEKEVLVENYNFLKKYKLIEDYNEENTFSKQLEIENLEDISYTEFLDRVKNQLAVRNLFFEDTILRQVITSLFINELLILTGPSGTGKTSLINYLAEIINAEIINIPVQPSWHDKQDLLGYYNPISKLFISSPFIDMLKKANDEPNKLFIINLDEINLAKIEYYLAELLSILELENQNLILYSEQEYQKNIQELKTIENYLSDIKISNYTDIIGKDLSLYEFSEYKSRRSNILDFPFSIQIPDNIRIVGTMNVEGLVEPLSPKVIDRAMVVPIERVSNGSIINETKKTFIVNADWWQTEQRKFYYKKQIIFNDDQLGDLLKIGIKFNSRLQKHMDKYYNKLSQLLYGGEQLESSITYRTIDDLILMKFLPKVHHIKNDTNQRLLFTHFDYALVENTYPISFKKYTEMKDKSVDSKIVSFWS